MDLFLKEIKHDDKKEWSFLTFVNEEFGPLKWVSKRLYLNGELWEVNIETSEVTPLKNILPERAG